MTTGPSESAAAGLRYVALGDSYTIGTSVSADERWPDQLVDRLEGGLVLTANLGVNGYSSDDLIQLELPQLAALDPGFVTLAIGVNDVVRGVPESTYVANVGRILDELLTRLAPDRILVVATPDYTVTPMGASYGSPAQQSAAIARFNAILLEAATDRGIAAVPEIFEISRAAATDASLTAADGLHPSGSQYGLWVDVIAPAVERLVAP
ncbi:MAG TPA: SGNH/GDSL hydrolase family protein [Candidatus Limnocylindria bacterium]